MATGDAAGLVELRVLDGPNLYFTRPAIKLTLSAKEWLEAPDERVLDAAIPLGLRGAARAAGRPGGAPASGSARPGPPGSERRLRFVIRLAAHLTRRLARATNIHLAIRARAGHEPDQVIVAFPWRRRTASEAFGRRVADLFEEILRDPDSAESLLQ